MKPDKLIQILEGLGLSEKEAQVYLSALQAGPSTISNLAKVSKIKRTTCYSVIDSLISKQIIRKELHGIKERFLAIDPSELSKLIEQKRDALLDALPNFEALKKLGQGESVFRYIEGLDAFREAYLEMINSTKVGDDYLVFSNMEKWVDLFKDFTTEFLKQRSKLPIKVKMLLQDGPIARLRMGDGRFGNEETKIIKSTNPIETNLIITPCKLFMHQFVPPYIGIIMENRHFIQMHREMYMVMWRGLG